MTQPILIDGALVTGAAVMEVINPATRGIAGAAYVVDAVQVDTAVRAAHRAFPGWAALSLDERRCYMARMASAVEENAEALARLLTEEQGKPISEARGEVGGLVWLMSRYAAYENPVEVLVENDHERVELHRLPLGVVVGIVPWNFPLFMAGIKIGTALVTGNTAVIKPAPTTPLATLELGRIWADILPPGVLNIIADQGDMGAELTTHPLVRKISFTGSTATGRKIMAAAADGLKRITLELGGNDAALILPGTEIESIADDLFGAAFRNNGQVCVAVKRVYVHRDQQDQLCDALVARARAARVGNGLDETTTQGPLQNASQFAKVQDYIALAHREGKVLTGGETPDERGYFITPAIVRDLPESSALIEEEQFGPILPVIAYDDPLAVVAALNDHPLGLGNSIWADDGDAAADIARRIVSGTVWINRHGATDPSVPFGGARASGIGAEHGIDGLAGYTQIRVISQKR